MSTLQSALPFERCDIRCIADSLSLEIGALHGRRITVETEGEMGARWSGSELRDILAPLLMNAVRYGDDARISVRIRRREGRLVVSVHNEGIAMTPEAKGHMFEPRTGAHMRGLAFVRRIVEAHGGDIRVEGGSGSGTTMTLDLPVAARAA